MPLVNMKDMLLHAYENGYAVGAFDLVGLDFLPAILAAAESARAPVVLSVTETVWAESDRDWVLAAVEMAARQASVPVAVHWDGGTSVTSAVRAIRMGANSIMVASGRESLSRNMEQTRAVVDMAHACGVPVEGELGYVPDADSDEDGTRDAARYTTVAEAKGFVERTGVDCLAVSIGTAYGRAREKFKLDWGRLKEINAALKMPLVIHGGTGLNDQQCRKLIMLGVAKIHYRAGLNDAAGGRLRDNVRRNRSAGYSHLQAGIREAVMSEVEPRLRAWGSAGRAAEVLTRCRPWLDVERVVVYNAPDLSEDQLRLLMMEGQRVFSGIPGVRAVRAGSVVEKSTRYRHCWLVRLVSAAAVAGFRQHPAQIAFTDRRFGPVAFDRIVADYHVVDDMPSAAVLPISMAPRVNSESV